VADSVYGLSAATGMRLWATAKANRKYDFTAPIVEGSTAWMGARPTTLEVQWATGAVNWTTADLGSPFYPYIYGAVAVNSTSLFQGGVGITSLGSNTKALGKIARIDGSFQKWETLGAWRSPICVQDTIYIVGGNANSEFDPSQRLATRRLDGSIRWTAPEVLDRDTSSPALAHGILVATGQLPQQSARVHGIRASDGVTLWTRTFGPDLLQMHLGYVNDACTSSSPAIAGSVVYIGALDGCLYALDLFTGAELWKYFVGAPIASSPAISGDFVFVGASDGHLWAFARADIVEGTSAPAVGSAPEDGLRFTSAPNPGADAVRFTLSLPRKGRTVLEVFDVRGRRVRTALDGDLEAGQHDAVWDGRDDRGQALPAGVYFARLEAGGESVVRKVVLLRR